MAFNRNIAPLRSMTGKDFMNKFFDLCKDAQKEKA